MARAWRMPSGLLADGLLLGNSGERSAACAPQRAARCNARGPCAAAVIMPCGRGAGRIVIRSGKCTPWAPLRRANRASAPISKAKPRRRQTRESMRAVCNASAAPKLRSTTPAPRGRRDAIVTGSRHRCGSVKNSKGGKAAGAPDRAWASRAALNSSRARSAGERQHERMINTLRKTPALA